jgi:hypothetical protein
MQEDQRTLTEDQIYRLDGNSGATVVVIYVLSDFPFLVVVSLEDFAS